MRRITILSLSITFTLFLTLSAFALTKEERAWKEDILILLSLVKRVGDYSEVVDLIEVAPALKKDQEIRKAYVDFAPPGVTPPEWARGKEPVLPAKIEVPEKIPTVKTTEKVSRRESEQVSEEEQRMKKKERREIKEKEARRIAQEVAAQRKVREREAAPPEKIAIAETTEKVSPEGQAYGAGRWESEQVSREEQRIRPTPLPKAAKVIHSTDVVSGVRAEMVEGKMRVIITLSGERKYTVSERTRPPSIIINIPHTMNTIFPETIPINRGCVKAIKAIQYRCLPFDEARIIVVLNRRVEYEVRSRNNEIHIEFKGGE